MLVCIPLLIFSYLLGSVSTALICCRLFSLPDLRQHGSGNPGATNMLRLYGKKMALLVVLGDSLKGFFPVWIAAQSGMTPLCIALTGLASFYGHLYPVFFSFRGGKGVATLLGILFATYWPTGLCFLGIWLLVLLPFRSAALSALAATAIMPVYLWLLTREPIFLASFSIMAIVLIWRHRENMYRLWLDGKNL